MGKMNSFQGLLAYWFLKIISWLFQVLPLSLALAIGRALGYGVYLFHTKARRKVLSHLRIAFGGQWESKKIYNISKEFFTSFGQSIVEIARLPLIAKYGYQHIVELKGEEQVKEALKENKGCFFLSIHSGNWELANIVGSMLGFPYNMVANSQEHINKVADFLASLRQSAGCKIIYPGLGGRDIIKAIKRNEIVTIVADQGGDDGVLVPFFGREASMSTGAVRLALKYGTPILMVNMRRKNQQGQHVLTAKRFDLITTGNEEQDLRSNMMKMAHVYQEWIRQSPCEYVWIYKTWKYSKQRKIVVLDDGRTGHLRQSQAVARVLLENLQERNRFSSIQEIKINFKSSWLVRAISFMPLLIQNMIWGDSFCFAQKILTTESFDQLFASKADYVISTGSSIALINDRYTRFNDDARSIVIMDPQKVPLNRFSVVILPQHDDKKERRALKNLVVVQAAPNLITDDYLTNQGNLLRERYPFLNIQHQQFIGVLMGGDAKGVKMSLNQIRQVIEQIKEIALKLNKKILITTSRRTPEHIEKEIEQMLKAFSHTALFISPKRENIPEAVGGILNLSEVVVVSGESVSMVSEAASSMAKTVVFDLEDDRGVVQKNKYTQFVMRMHEKEFLLRSTAACLFNDVVDLLENKKKITRLDDMKIIKKELRKIIR